MKSRDPWVLSLEHGSSEGLQGCRGTQQQEACEARDVASDIIYCFGKQYCQPWIMTSSFSDCRNNRQGQGYLQRRALVKAGAWVGRGFIGRKGRRGTSKLNHKGVASGSI